MKVGISMSNEVTFMPMNKTIVIRNGVSLLEAARKANIAIRTRCGGKAGCLMCKLKQLSASGLSDPSEQEKRKLGSALAEGIRLGCQARITGDTIVEVPEDPLQATVRRLLQQQEDDALW